MVVMKRRRRLNKEKCCEETEWYGNKEMEEDRETERLTDRQLLKAIYHQREHTHTTIFFFSNPFFLF